MTKIRIGEPRPTPVVREYGVLPCPFCGGEPNLEQYIEEQRNIHRLWCGSENQRIWRRMTSGWIADAPEYEKSLNELNLDEQHTKECGCE